MVTAEFLKCCHVYSHFSPVIVLPNNRSGGNMATGLSHILCDQCSFSHRPPSLPSPHPTPSMQPSISHHLLPLPLLSPLSLSLSLFLPIFVIHMCNYLAPTDCPFLHELYLIYNEFTIKLVLNMI